MNKGWLRTLQVFVWIVCLSHIAIGILVMLSPPLQQKVADLYGAQVEWTPQFTYILRPLGAFMLILGVVGIAAALNPLRYRFIVYGFVGLLLIRVFQRIIFHDDIQQTFQIPEARNICAAGLFLLLAVILLFLMLKALKNRPATTGQQ